MSVWILRGEEEETTIGLLKVEKCERMRTVVDVDVFEAEALTDIYSPKGEIVDILERVKATPINGRGSVASLITMRTRC